MTSRPYRWLLFLTTAFVLFVAGRASANPEAHILRIDPRAGLTNGAPLLTTVVEVVQFNSYSDVFLPCANVSGAGPSIDCISAQTEKPNAVWSGFASKLGLATGPLLGSFVLNLPTRYQALVVSGTVFVCLALLSALPPVIAADRRASRSPPERAAAGVAVI